ncbi:MAG TPA: hypothetical protein PKG48_00265 [Bacteroidales bacterium]|nr:hypothetical protein [Bacteroidales bacterium]
MTRDFREIVLAGSREINRLEKFVEEICDYYNINNEYFGNVLLATTEGVRILTSIHESKEKEKIVISFERSSTGLIFKIKLVNGQDEAAEGGDDDLEREIKKHKLARDIFIIRALSDEITISVNAKSIVMVFYVSSMNYEKSLQRINELKEYWVKKNILIPKK